MEGIPTDIDAEYLVSSRDAGILRHIKSLAHESRGSNFDKCSLGAFYIWTHWPLGDFKLILVNAGWGISNEIPLRWMPLDLTDDQSTLVQVMAWCRQAASHYLSQCWLRSMSPNDVTRPQWVKYMGTSCGIALMWLAHNALDSILVQVMACCRQALIVGKVGVSFLNSQFGDFVKIKISTL